jgi:hypothetical protein
MDMKKIVILLLCSVVVAVGFIIGASIFSSALAERPLIGSFSGSLSSSDYSSDIMDTDGLMYYLAIYPEVDTDYDAENNSLKSELENNIINDKWPDFPYVNINGRLYFSKQAVDEWFLEKGKAQLEIK